MRRSLSNGSWTGHSRSTGSERARRRKNVLLGLAAVAVAVFGAGCSSDDSVAETATPVEGCADVVDATVERSGSRFVVTATVRSADTGWDRYADAWEVRTTDGEVLGTRILAHPHVDEQPFTRSLVDVQIPETSTSVEIAAHDSVVGFCGVTMIAAVPAP